MKIFNEETNRKNGTCVLIIDCKEAKALIEIVEIACKASKRKPKFKFWKKELEEKLCYS